MKHAVGERVRSWLATADRSDITPDHVDIPDHLFNQVFAETAEQHPEEPMDHLEERTLYRILTHPEWTPLAKDSSGLTEAKDSPVPVLYRMMGAAAESARGAASSATIAALQCGMALQHADRAAAAEERTIICSQSADAAFKEALRCSLLASTALGEYTRIAKRQMIIKFIIIGLLLLGLALLVARPAHGQDNLRIFEAQGNEPITTRRMGISPSGIVRQGSTINKFTASDPPSPPALTADQKFRIRDLQHKYDDLRVQAVKLEMDKMKLERQITDVLSSINGIAFDIARESKVATDNWNLNIDNLTWEKRK